MNVSKKKTPEFKIILVGDAAVGKTSIIMRFQHDIFMEDYQNTITASYFTKMIETERGPANLNIWDTAGQEKYKSLVPMYSKGAAAAIIVFDASEKDSFEVAQTWIQQVKHDAPEDCQVFVVGNKIDKLQDGQLLQEQSEEIKNYCNKYNCRLKYVSALSGSGINSLFQDVAHSIPSVRFQSTTEAINVSNDNNNNNKQSCC